LELELSRASAHTFGAMLRSFEHPCSRLGDTNMALHGTVVSLDHTLWLVNSVVSLVYYYESRQSLGLTAKRDFKPLQSQPATLQ
jgi:hypothetical protein